MSLEAAEPRTSRRSAIAMVGTAGAVGLGASLLATRQAAAAAPVTSTPSAPTAADTDLLLLAMGLELAAGELYALAVAALNDETARTVAAEFGSNHEAYAEAIAGTAGLSADNPNQEVFEQLRSSFDTSDVKKFATAAAQLEATASATHNELVGALESATARTISASILVIEARQSTVATDLAGEGNDLEAMLYSDAQPLTLAEVAG